MKDKTKKTMVARNSKARHDYRVEDSYQAGLVLKGAEVKSLRTKNVSFDHDRHEWKIAAHEFCSLGHFLCIQSDQSLGFLF